MCRCNMILNENITIDMFLGDRSIHIHLFNIYINVFLLWKLSQSHVFPTETLDLLRVLCLYFFGGLIRRSFCSHPGVILQLLGDFQLKKWSFNGRLLWDIMGYLYIYLSFFWYSMCLKMGGSNTPENGCFQRERDNDIGFRVRVTSNWKAVRNLRSRSFPASWSYNTVAYLQKRSVAAFFLNRKGHVQQLLSMIQWCVAQIPRLCSTWIFVQSTFSRFSDASTTRTQSISGGAAPSGGYSCPWTGFRSLLHFWTRNHIWREKGPLEIFRMPLDNIWYPYWNLGFPLNFQSWTNP